MNNELKQDLMDYTRLCNAGYSLPERTARIRSFLLRVGHRRFNTVVGMVLNASAEQIEEWRREAAHQPAVTEWYIGRDPVRSGVYEVGMPPIVAFAYFCVLSRSWYAFSPSRDRAAAYYEEGRLSRVGYWKWRGLAENPDRTPITDKQRLDWLEEQNANVSEDESRTFTLEDGETLRQLIDREIRKRG
jgi:hypothetical protein